MYESMWRSELTRSMSSLPLFKIHQARKEANSASL
jgi:hypothetical protein